MLWLNEQRAFFNIAAQIFLSEHSSLLVSRLLWFEQAERRIGYHGFLAMSLWLSGLKRILKSFSVILSESVSGVRLSQTRCGAFYLFSQTVFPFFSFDTFLT